MLVQVKSGCHLLSG